MSNTYDVVIAGAGHNSLTVGCYLTKAGFNVCMLERNKQVGGGVVSFDGITAPGFITDPCSTIHFLMQQSPIIKNDELGLIKNYGLKYLYPEVQMCIHFTDGTTLSIYKSKQKTVDAIAKYSPEDAAAYDRFCAMAQGGATTIVQGFYSPAPPYGMFMSMMDSSPEGQELIRFLSLSVQDVINEYFKHPKVRIALTRWISEIMVNPATKGTGVMVFVMLGLAHMEPGGGMPVGGSGVLSEKMAQFIRDNGGTILTEHEVDQFIIEGGTCKGVRCKNGEEFYGTKMVVSSCHLKNMFPGMVPEGTVSPEFQMKVDRLKHAFSAFQQSVALNEYPEYVCSDPELNEAFLTEFAPCDEYEYDKYFFDLERGIGHGHFPLIGVQSKHDPTRAPAGKHVMYLYEYAPYAIDGDPNKWDEIRESYAQEIFDFLKPYIRNFGPENILGQYIQSPLDMTRLNPSFVQGDFAHIASYTEQFMGNRPIQGLPGGQFCTPVDKLMICGPQCHPGSGCSGGGRAAAIAVLEKLGTTMDQVING